MSDAGPGAGAGTGSGAQPGAAIELATLGDLEHQLWRLLRRMRRNTAERARLVAPGLSALGYGVLDQLVRDGSGRAVEIGCQLGVDKGAVSRTVHQLLGLGLVERVSDPDDARAAVLTLTPLGRERMNEVNTQRRERFVRLMSGWTDDELSHLVATLDRYNATVDAVIAESD